MGLRINVLGFEGYVPVVVRSSKQRQLASRHLNAVGRFLRPPGDTEVLKSFVGKRVGGVELLTDPERLRELGKAEEIKLDAFYRQHRGASSAVFELCSRLGSQDTDLQLTQHGGGWSAVVVASNRAQAEELPGNG